MKALKVQEIEKANLHPLNRISKQWLELAGVHPDPRSLHALTLVSWALGEHAIRVDPTRDPRLPDRTEATLLGMATKWQPDNVMEFLEACEAGCNAVTPDELEQAGSPVDAAQILLGRIASGVLAARNAPAGCATWRSQ